MKWIKEYQRLKRIDERALNEKSIGFIKTKGSERIISNIFLYKKALDELIDYTIESDDFNKIIDEIPKDQEETYRLVKLLKELKHEING